MITPGFMICLKMITRPRIRPTMAAGKTRAPRSRAHVTAPVAKAMARSRPVRLTTSSTVIRPVSRDVALAAGVGLLERVDGPQVLFAERGAPGERRVVAGTHGLGPPRGRARCPTPMFYNAGQPEMVPIASHLAALTCAHDRHCSQLEKRRGPAPQRRLITTTTTAAGAGGRNADRGTWPAMWMSQRAAPGRALRTSGRQPARGVAGGPTPGGFRGRGVGVAIQW